MAEAIPPRLFKYQPYNVQTLDNLRNRVIWFSFPEVFNDPFDISIIPTPAEPSPEEWELITEYTREVYRRVGPRGLDYWDGLYLTHGKPNKEFKRMIMDSTNLSSAYMQLDNRTHGVACFSGTAEDILMWAHYADGHRGFCLEFDTRFAPFRDATAIHYDNQLPSMNVADAHLGKGFPNVAITTTKSKHWEYEQEWRIFSSRGNSKVEYDTAALTGIYIGCAVPPEHAEVIAMLLSGSPAEENVSEMRRSQTEFRVEPRLVAVPARRWRKRTDDNAESGKRRLPAVPPELRSHRKAKE